MESSSTDMVSYDSYRQLVTFAVLLSVCIPSVICSLVVLIFFATHWSTMISKALQHHSVFILIVISLLYTTIDVPFSLNYFRIGQHPYRSIRFCIWWYWIDYSLLSMSLFVTATASIQRHILIFHSNWLNISRKRCDYSIIFRWWS